jgi:hypothetical protein
MGRNPFGDEEPDRPGPVNPFGEPADPDAPSADPDDPAGTIAYSAARIRRLKNLVGSEGLTLSGTRELLDHISAALDATARALRDRESHR